MRHALSLVTGWIAGLGRPFSGHPVRQFKPANVTVTTTYRADAIGKKSKSRKLKNRQGLSRSLIGGFGVTLMKAGGGAGTS